MGPLIFTGNSMEDRCKPVNGPKLDAAIKKHLVKTEATLCCSGSCKTYGTNAQYRKVIHDWTTALPKELAVCTRGACVAFKKNSSSYTTVRAICHRTYVKDVAQNWVRAGAFIPITDFNAKPSNYTPCLFPQGHKIRCGSERKNW